MPVDYQKIAEMLTGAYPKVQQGLQSARESFVDPSPAAAVAAAMNALPGARLARPAGIRAYHGSPYNFDRFDMSKIGTGEGKGAYGHGLYFAENEAVAKDYRDKLVGSGAVQRALDELYGSGATSRTPGHMYEVNINAKPEQFLDWDKPLAQMGPEVQQALSSFSPHMTGAQINESARLVPGAYRDNRVATENLRGMGIPGIKYLDQGSRGQGAGTSNYVLFDDKLVDIVRKYGLFGLGAPGLALPSQGEGQQ